MTKVNLLTAVACVLAGASSAGTTAKLDKSDVVWTSSFTNAANWKVGSKPVGGVGEALNASYDYLVAGRELRTPAHIDASFAGHSLSIGEPSLTSGSGTLAIFKAKSGTQTFDFSAGDGLILNRGFLCSWYGSDAIVKGKVTVRSKQSGTPFVIYANGSRATIYFDAAFVGEEDTGLWLYCRDEPNNTNWSQSNFICRFRNNALAGYLGTINCYQSDMAYADRKINRLWRTEFAADTDTPFPGTLRLGFNCAVRCNETTGTVSVGTVDFGEESGITVLYDKTSKKASCVKVTKAFSKVTPIRVFFDMSQAFSATTPEGYAAADAVPELAVFKAPSGVTLKAEDFVLEQSIPFPLFDMYVRTDTDGLSTLYVKQHGKVVYQTAKDVPDDYEAGTGSWISGAHWSDGCAPSNCSQYVTDKTVRTRDKGTTAPYVFQGYSLAKFDGELDMGIVSHEVISNLVILGTGKQYPSIWNYWANSLKISGRIYQYNDSEEGLSVYVYGGRPVEIASDIYGKGWFQLFQTQTAHEGHMTLSGNNENFYGNFYFSSKYSSHSEFYSVKVHVTDPKNLGGDSGTWNCRGVYLTNHATLCPDAPMTLETPNRGILISGQAYVSNAYDFFVKQRMTWTGVWTKRGVGTLGLGGESPYFSTASGTTPASGKNILEITAGALKPFSSAAFQGIEVRFSAGTRLLLDAQASVTDGGLGQYGMRNTVWTTPFVLPTDGLDVVIADPEDNLSKISAVRRRVAIATVPTAQAGILRGKFNLDTSAVPKFDKVEFVEIANADGTVTFACKFGRLGGTILLR